jgi:hypothetical protein
MANGTCLSAREGGGEGVYARGWRKAAEAPVTHAEWAGRGREEAQWGQGNASR